MKVDTQPYRNRSMNRQFLELYKQELAYVRAASNEFAQSYPKIAGRLGGLDRNQPCTDPFVERLLEGFAFLSARVQHKLNAGFSRFTQSLLETLYPHYLAPTPSMCMVQFQPDYDDPILADGFKIARETSLDSMLGKGDQTRCRYRTAHDVTLWPVKIIEANYLTRELASLYMPATPDISAGIQMRLQISAGLSSRQIELDSLRVHLCGSDEVPARLYEQLFTDVAGTLVQPSENPGDGRTLIKKNNVGQVGFSDDECLLPYENRSFQGYRLLHEYSVFPRRYMFADIMDLRDAIKRCNSNQIDIIVLLKKSQTELEGAVTKDNLKLFCTPAINLFKKHLDRIPVSQKQSEYHVIPDRMRPEDFEIFQIKAMHGYGSGSEQIEEFTPFYQTKNTLGSRKSGYYTAHRVPRTPLQWQRPHQQSSTGYLGSEVYVSLVDSCSTVFHTDVKQLGVEALCTNGNLPIHMPAGVGKTDFSMEKAAPCLSIRCLGPRTMPRPSHAEGGHMAWRMINHLSYNHLSLAGEYNNMAASVLRDLLKLYSDSSKPAIQKQIHAVRALNCKQITRRIISSDNIGFARGLEVTLELEESALTGTGAFLLGAVLERFFAKSVSINSFTETVVKTIERGEIKRWNKNRGKRHIL